MKYRLPLATEQAVREAEMSRSTLADRFEAEVRKKAVDEKQPVMCLKGCHHCCYYPVVMSLLEGVTLFRWLAEHGLWRKPLKEAFEATHRKVWGLAPSVWMLSMTPCPLLDDQGTCSAYESRPFVCRTTVAFSDPYYCHPHQFASGEANLVARRATDEALHAVEIRLLSKLRMTRLRLPLATAVLVGERICKEGLEPEEANEYLFEEWARNC